MSEFKNWRNPVAIKADWYDAKKKAVQVGPPVFVEQWWVPVLWEDEEDPDFHKAAGLDGVVFPSPSTEAGMSAAVKKLLEFVDHYRSEWENPAKDYALRATRRQQMFKAALEVRRLSAGKEGV